MNGTIGWQKDREAGPFRVPELRIDPRRTALLIVDMQNKFAKNLPGPLPNNLRLLEFFREHGLPVMFCRVGSLLPEGRDLHVKRRLTWLRPVEGGAISHCPKGCFDYEVAETLKPRPSEPVIDKNSQGAFNSSTIDHYLRAMDIQNIVVTGVSTSRCVEGTAGDAADLGCNVILVEDACNDTDPDKHRVAVATFARTFGAVKNTAEVIEELSRLLAEA